MGLLADIILHPQYYFMDSIAEDIIDMEYEWNGSVLTVWPSGKDDDEKYIIFYCGSFLGFAFYSCLLSYYYNYDPEHPEYNDYICGLKEVFKTTVRRKKIVDFLRQKQAAGLAMDLLDV